MATPNDLSVTDNVEARRFEARDGSMVAFLDYRRAGNRLVLVHTEVPPEMEGRGVGGRLARAALEHARAAGLKVVPRCSFVASYIERHPEYMPLVVSSAPPRDL